jgi:ADP-heptose:LPS heptosyltransferase
LSSRLEQRELRLDEPPLPLLAGVLSLATAYLGNDSGISHLAAALGVPAVVLFGRDRIAWRPWAKHLAPLVVSMPTLDEPDVARVVDALRPLLG